MDKEYISRTEKLLREKEEEVEKLNRQLNHTRLDLQRANDELFVIRADQAKYNNQANETFELRMHVERLQQKIAQLAGIIKKERAAAAAAAHIPNLEEEIDSSRGSSKNIFKTRSKRVYDVDNEIYFVEGECQKKGKGKLDEGTSGGGTKH